MSTGASYDIIIVGSGPAAYQAALYCKDVNILILEGGIVGNNGPGGQLTTTTLVDNYPGFPHGINGPELMEIMKKQVKHPNVVTKEQTVTNIEEKDKVFCVKTEKDKFIAKSVIIATGAQAKRLDAKGTDIFWQNGISSCAVCDGFLFLDKVVAVIGGGDSAMEEALHLASIASKVYIIHRRDEFRSRKDMLERAEKNKKIEILRSYTLVEAKGNETLQSIAIKNLKTDEIEDLEVSGMFFAIGHTPNTSFIADNFLKKDETGYLLVDKNLQTSREGIFACGDVQDKIYRQANTAAATGCLAAISALKYLKNQ
ncbi:Thioredoxin reductase [Pseudoloma neurophilia]|uniref:Thioredoxin reductase n=1 Tax=Pseudoloma neurophilia TaxID=146866 RepID=A0A0R0M5Q4_9MICR|nr:Thioredoxin reductase [Pseudoloma neurophilia]